MTHTMRQGDLEPVFVGQVGMAAAIITDSSREFRSKVAMIVAVKNETGLSLLVSKRLVEILRGE